MSLKNMNILVKEGYLDSKEVHTLDFCEECILGKSHKQSFPEAKHTTTGILEYVHSDLWGSVSNESSLSPNASLKFKIPEEVWSGSKVDYIYLRRFGCVAYVHIQQDKMSPRAVKGIFMGYPLGTKGYRVWLPEDGKCTISRNVVFDEEKLYKEKVEVPEAKQKKKVSFSTQLIQGPSTGDSVQSSTGQGGADSGNTSSNGLDGADSEDTESTGQGGANFEGTESGT
ncbi:unnamed protein product [Arabidopsis halleri]